jgi:hypothetical protein
MNAKLQEAIQEKDHLNNVSMTEQESQTKLAEKVADIEVFIIILADFLDNHLTEFSTL